MKHRPTVFARLKQSRTLPENRFFGEGNFALQPPGSPVIFPALNQHAISKTRDYIVLPGENRRHVSRIWY